MTAGTWPGPSALLRVSSSWPHDGCCSSTHRVLAQRRQQVEGADLPCSLKWEECHLRGHPPTPPTADFPSHLLGQKWGCPHPAVVHTCSPVSEERSRALLQYLKEPGSIGRIGGRGRRPLVPAWWRAEAVGTSGKSTPCSLRRGHWDWRRWPQSLPSSPVTGAAGSWAGEEVTSWALSTDRLRSSPRGARDTRASRLGMPLIAAVPQSPSHSQQQGHGCRGGDNGA